MQFFRRRCCAGVVSREMCVERAVDNSKDCVDGVFERHEVLCPAGGVVYRSASVFIGYHLDLPEGDGPLLKLPDCCHFGVRVVRLNVVLDDAVLPLDKYFGALLQEGWIGMRGECQQSAIRDFAFSEPGTFAAGEEHPVGLLSSGWIEVGNCPVMVLELHFGAGAVYVANNYGVHLPVVDAFCVSILVDDLEFPVQGTKPYDHSFVWLIIPVVI